MKKLFRLPLINILLILIITGFFAYQLPNTKIDNDVLTFLPSDHPARIAIDNLEDLFGGSMLIDVVMESERGSIMTPEGMALLRTVSSKLEQIPGVEDVQSLFTTDYMQGTADGMEVLPLIDTESSFSTKDIKDLRKRLVSWDVYRKMLISDDFSATQIGVKYSKSLSIEEREDIYQEIESITADSTSGEFHFYTAGTPAITVLVSQNMISDLKTLVPFVLAVLIIMLALSFRRFGGVILPLLTVMISTIWIVGFMALIQVPLSILGTIIPVLILAVGSAYGIHIVSHYYDEIAERKELPDSTEHTEIVLTTVRRVGIPILLAGLTTLAGFGSLTVSHVVPMKVFGIFTALGVFIALLVALIFIPSVLLLRHSAMKPQKRSNAAQPGLIVGTILKRLNILASGYSKLVLVLFVLVIGVSAWGASKLIIDNALIEYFKTDTDIRISDQKIREKFSGTKTFDLIIHGENPADLTNPAILDAMDKLASHLTSTYPQVTKVLSYSDFIRRMNQVMHVDEPGEFGNVATTSSTVSEADTGGFSDQPDFPQADFGDSSFTEDSFYSGDSDEKSSSSDTGGGDWADAEAWGTADETSSQAENGGVDAYHAATKLLTEAYASGEDLTMSAGELVHQAEKLVNLNGAAYDEIPVDPEKYGLNDNEGLKNLVSQYLLLYSGSLDEWADDALEPQTAKMSITMNTTGNIFTNELLPDIEDYVANYFPEGYTVSAAGVALAESAVTDLITGSAIHSILLSLLFVFIIVAITYKTPVAGLLAVVPLGVTVLINFAAMGLFGIKLDIATAMVGSIAIGIGIDYTIHFLASYRYARLESANLALVTQQSLYTSGKAIIYNALSVTAGFLVLAFSHFYPLLFLGVLIALTMITSSLASMTIMPVMLNTIRPKFISAPGQKNPGERSDQGDNNA